MAPWSHRTLESSMVDVLGGSAVGARSWRWAGGGVPIGMLLVLMSACSTAPTLVRPGPTVPGSAAAPGSDGRPAVPQAPPPAPALAAESRWLTSLFSATPVRIAEGEGGVVSLQVPLVHAFDAASNEPKPAVRAVLDRVTQSLLRQPSARLEILAPPPSARGGALRAYVTRQGIAAWRVSAAAEAVEPQSVWLRLVPGTAPVRRLNDASLPSPVPGSVLPPKPAPAGAAQRRP